MDNIVIVALNPVCDFCAGTDIVVAYLIEDFSLPEFHWGSKGAFAACHGCRNLIETGKVRELEERALLSMRMELHELGVPVELMRAFIRRMHSQFWLRLRGGTRQ